MPKSAIPQALVRLSNEQYRKYLADKDLGERAREALKAVIDERPIKATEQQASTWIQSGITSEVIDYRGADFGQLFENAREVTLVSAEPSKIWHSHNHREQLLARIRKPDFETRLIFYIDPRRETDAFYRKALIDEIRHEMGITEDFKPGERVEGIGQLYVGSYSENAALPFFALLTEKVGIVAWTPAERVALKCKVFNAGLGGGIAHAVFLAQINSHSIIYHLDGMGIPVLQIPNPNPI